MKCRFIHAFLVGWGLFCFVLFHATPVFAAHVSVLLKDTERIELFDSSAVFTPAGVMRVTEHITVVAAGVHINHGIFRTLPRYWTRGDGKRFAVQYTVRDMQREGAPEPYSVVVSDTSLTVRIGDAAKQVPAGPHTYAVTYDVSNHFSRFENWDELYWNVTGNDWLFPIMKARFHLAFAAGEDASGGPGKTLVSVPWRSVDVYTGARGEKEQYAKILADGGVETTKPLEPGQGITVAYTWDRSVLASAPAPEEFSLLHRFFVPNSQTAGLWAIPFALGCLYAVLWRRRRVPGGMPAVIPLFSAPQHLSPGELRYVEHGIYDGTGFAADMLNIIAKGGMSFAREQGANACRITKGQTTFRQPLTASEHAVVQELFGSGGQSVDLKQRAVPAVQRARVLLAASCRGARKNLFQNTIGLCIPAAGGVILLPLFGVVCSTAVDTAQGSALLLVVTVMLLFLVFSGRALLARGFSWGLLPFLLFFCSFLGGLVPVLLGEVLPRLDMPEGYVGVWAAYGAVFTVVVCTAPRYTAEGLQRLSWVRGLRLYLGTAEKERFEAMYPPQESVEHFEALLPYALALGVGKTWANRFAAYLQTAGVEAEQFNNMAWADFTSFSRDSARASSSSAGASGSGGRSGSGSGGGGRSGGGSGGGGGGGW